MNPNNVLHESISTEDLRQQIDRIAAKAPRKSFWFIEPRYTCGSPAMISEQEVIRIAVQEIQARESQRSGVYGEEMKNKADTLGVENIAFARWEAGGKTWRLDLLTGLSFVEPKRLGWSERDRLRELRGYKKHWERIGAPDDFPSTLKVELESLEIRAALHREVIS